MRSIEFRNILLSVWAAITVVICLGLAIFAVIMLTRGEDAIDNADSGTGKATACQFTSQVDPLPLYHAPVSAPSQQETSAEAGVAYPIINQNRGYYLLQINDTLTAYADSRDGTVDGDCDNVPIDETPLSEFPTVCAFTNPAETVLFSKPELVNPIGSVPPGSHLVDVINGDRYYLILDENMHGWVLGTEGELSGACEAITQ